jgi:hypothetical protein
MGRLVEMYELYDPVRTPSQRGSTLFRTLEDILHAGLLHPRYANFCKMTIMFFYRNKASTSDTESTYRHANILYSTYRHVHPSARILAMSAALTLFL